MNYINISGYKFAELADLKSLQKSLQTLCDHCELKGTLLLAHEGINAFASGTSTQIEEFITALDLIIPGIVFKKSSSESQPFRFMRVKIKPEIVTFGVPEVDVLQSPAPNISAQMLHQWLEEGKDIVLLDTRNDYEVDMGQFRDAMSLSIENFRDFPLAAKDLPESLKNKTIVTYCTGGIRCEKAAPYLMQLGYTSVYQLEGGILTYLEKFPEGYFQGDCFVFDDRVAVDGDLRPRDQQ